MDKRKEERGDEEREERVSVSRIIVVSNNQ